MQIDELKREKTPLGVQVFLLKRLNGELGYQISRLKTAIRDLGGDPEAILNSPPKKSPSIRDWGKS